MLSSISVHPGMIECATIDLIEIKSSAKVIKHIDVWCDTQVA